MKLVCIGDSLTTGYGVFRNECWVSIIRDKLKIDILNKGINGDTTAGMLSRSFRDVVENNPTHVIIMGGCNDFMGGRSLNMVKDNLSELIKEALMYNIVPIVGIEPEIDEFLAKKKWSGSLDYKKINEVEKEYRNWIIKFCKENSICYIDFYNCFYENLKSINSRQLLIDGIHPSILGHKLMAEYAITSLKSIII